MMMNFDSVDFIELPVRPFVSPQAECLSLPERSFSLEYTAEAKSIPELMPSQITLSSTPAESEALESEP